MARQKEMTQGEINKLEYIRDYNRNTYRRVCISTKTHQATDYIGQAADKHGLSKNKYLIAAINEALERDGFPRIE